MRRGGSGDENGLEEVIPSTGVAPSFAERPHSLPKYGDRQGVRLFRALSRPGVFRMTRQDFGGCREQDFLHRATGGIGPGKNQCGRREIFL